MNTGELIWSEEGWAGSDFPQNARKAVEDSQLRRNLRKATATIRERRAGLVAETPDWQELRHAGAAIKDDVLHHLDQYLEQFERNATARGAHVHWARDAHGGDANRHDPRTTDRPRRGHQGQVDGHPGDRARQGARISRDRRPRNRPRRDDHPALGRPPESHRRAGAPPQPRRDPPDLPRPHARRPEGPDRRPTRARRSGPPAPPTPVPQDQGRGQRRELRDRARPAACSSPSQRATAACA